MSNTKAVQRGMNKIDRVGKTKKDKESGAWENRFSNRADRVAWEKDSKATNATFPTHACNGKKNRKNKKSKKK